MKKYNLIAFLAVFDIAFAIYSNASKKYERWTKPMKEMGYAWEALPVKTEDNY